MGVQRIFVTGATGFIGASLLRAAAATGYDVDALTRSDAAAAALRARGVNPIIADLADRGGAWRAAAGRAEAVIHLAQPQTFGERVTRARAKRYAARRLAMDRNLFDAIDPGKTERIIYVAGTSYYGECGPAICDEDAVPHPKGWGPYLKPAIDAIPGYVSRGLPIVVALPGWVYGPGSWFAQYILDPLSSGRPVYGPRGPSRFISPVHVDDCARALVHLIKQGEIGRRYFIVDDAPVPGERLVELAAGALGVTAIGRKVPLALLRLFLGQVVSESMTYENRLSNNRLKSTGFLFTFPTCNLGIPQVVQTWLKEKRGT